MFDGWPAFYKYFFDAFHWSLEDVQNCPIYLACILLGAIGPDHLNVRMTWKDTLRYYGSDPEKMQVLARISGQRQSRQLATAH